MYLILIGGCLGLGVKGRDRLGKVTRKLLGVMEPIT